MTDDLPGRPDYARNLDLEKVLGVGFIIEPARPGSSRIRIMIATNVQMGCAMSLHLLRCTIVQQARERARALLDTYTEINPTKGRYGRQPLFLPGEGRAQLGKQNNEAPRQILSSPNWTPPSPGKRLNPSCS